MVEIHRNLEENAYNVDLAVDAVLTEHARQTARKAKSTLWQDGGTGNRIFGNEVADSAVSKKSTQQLPNMSEKQPGRRKDHERKKGKRRGGNESNDEEQDLERYQPIAAMQTLSI